MQKSEIFISDLSKAVPKSALSTKMKKNCWRVIKYETDQGIDGTTLYAGPETDAPDIVYPLDLEGWYAIYIGIWGRQADKDVIRVKLKDDPCFKTFKRETFKTKAMQLTKWEIEFSIEEAFWKQADLTDQHIIFGQQSEGYSKSAYITYLRLVPLTQGQVKEIQEDRRRTDTKRLIATNDGFSFVYLKRPVTKEGIWEEIEPYRNTDFKDLHWNVWIGGSFLYPSKIGDVIGVGYDDFPRIGDRYVKESFEVLLAKGINPLKTALEYTHQVGLKFHAALRMGHWAMTTPMDYATGKFFREHPQWRCVDKEGTPISTMSYAYPEVRAYIISILKEVIRYGVDGISLMFTRQPPFLLYEKPLLDHFKERYGEDPREIDEFDERWLSLKGEYMTNFMRDIRKETEKIEKELNIRKVEISAHVLRNEIDNLYHGFDIKTWVTENLIDTLLPARMGRDIVGHSITEFDPEVINFFAKLTKHTRCKLCPKLGLSVTPADYRKRALSWYNAGVDGICFWDANEVHDSTALWSTFRKLGHVEELKTWVEEEKHEEEPRLLRLEMLDGYDVKKYPMTG